MEGNILLKLRENFEDKFRYDEAGVPRIWRPSDDIEGIYTKARESTLTLIPLLSRFRLSETYAPPDLPSFIGHQPTGVEAGDEEDLAPIGGIDEEEGKSLEEEMTVLSESKRQDLVVRFKKTADGVYVEAKRSAIGGVAQIPWYFYGLLLALGWNEIFMGKSRRLTMFDWCANMYSVAESYPLHPDPADGRWHVHCLLAEPPRAHNADEQRGNDAGRRHCQAVSTRLHQQLGHCSAGVVDAGSRQR